VKNLAEEIAPREKGEIFSLPFALFFFVSDLRQGKRRCWTKRKRREAVFAVLLKIEKTTEYVTSGPPTESLSSISSHLSYPVLLWL
jgi:hypothetical protein